MVLHIKQFREALYVEHLEEAAFLYETRLTWLHDSEVGWQELGEIDERMEAHLDALVIGQNLALKACLDLIEEAEPSQLHVIVRLYCRHRLIDRLAKLWQDFDFDDEDKVRAVADALKWECPADWHESLARVFTSTNAPMYKIAAPCVAYRAPSLMGNVPSALNKTEDASIQAVLLNMLVKADRALAKDVISLAGSILKEDSSLTADAAMAVLAMGEPRVLPLIAEQMEDMPLLFALGGSKEIAAAIIAQAAAGKANEQTLKALGLIGTLDAITQLLAYLKHPDYKQTAADALQLISSADLFETEHVADEVEAEELFDHELDDFKNGELPKNIDGQSFGGEVSKVTTEHQRWFEWFRGRRDSFQADQRYRCGVMYSPKALLHCLLDNRTVFELRDLIHKELIIRYGLTLPFAADELLETQKQQLNAIHQWVSQSTQQFIAGRWYFNGQEIL